MYNGSMTWREIAGWIVIASFAVFSLYEINDNMGFYTSRGGDALLDLSLKVGVVVLVWLWLNRKQG